MKKTFKFFCGSLLLAGVIGLSGCNTMAGFGEDLSEGGHAITKSAEKNK